MTKEEFDARTNAAKEAAYWADQKYVLEKNDCSRFHKFLEAELADKLVDGNQPETRFRTHTWDSSHVFLVKHDWAAAFKGASGIEDSSPRLPYETCVFEFRISGRSVICIFFDRSIASNYLSISIDHESRLKSGEEQGASSPAWIQCGEYWVSLAEGPFQFELMDLVQSQVTAICIALDSEVATHEVVRAPAALNAKRTRSGKVPLSDYHVVDLARRHRLANPSGGESGAKHRLHFVRGHWRHYEEHKTWIKWHLRGDPSLGFIQKHYTL